MLEEMTVSKAAELAELTPGQVSSIIFNGLVVPEIHDPNGSGDPSILSPKNVRELRLIGKLKKIGLKIKTIESIIQLLATSKMDWWNGGDSYVASTTHSWIVTDNPFSEANRKLFKKEGILLLVKL